MDITTSFKDCWSKDPGSSVNNQLWTLWECQQIIVRGPISMGPQILSVGTVYHQYFGPLSNKGVVSVNFVLNLFDYCCHSFLPPGSAHMSYGFMNVLGLRFSDASNLNVSHVYCLQATRS